MKHIMKISNTHPGFPSWDFLALTFSKEHIPRSRYTSIPKASASVASTNLKDKHHNLKKLSLCVKFLFLHDSNRQEEEEIRTTSKKEDVFAAIPVTHQVSYTTLFGH